MYDLVAPTLPADAFCGIIYRACNVTNASGYNYIQDMGFATFNDCYAFMTQLPAIQPCPYVQKSNTTACRQLHTFSSSSSFFLSFSTHCSHIRGGTVGGLHEFG